MTATYDGRLLMKEKTVEPCCARMSEALCLEAVKTGTLSKQRILKISIGPRWMVLRYCPFCGAEVNA
jgi:hypothetical protein